MADTSWRGATLSWSTPMSNGMSKLKLACLAAAIMIGAALFAASADARGGGWGGGGGGWHGGGGWQGGGGWNGGWHGAAMRGAMWRGDAQRSLAWWMARPLLSTSPLCVFPSPPLRTVLRHLCRRLLNVLVLGPDAAWLALCLGLWPLRLWVFLSCRGTHAAHSRASGNPVRAFDYAGSPPTRGRAAGVNPSALSFFRRLPEKSTSRRS